MARMIQLTTWSLSFAYVWLYIFLGWRTCVSRMDKKTLWSFVLCCGCVLRS